MRYRATDFRTLATTIFAGLAICVIALVQPATAQDTESAQVKLDEKMIQSVIDAQPKLREFAASMDEPGAELTDEQQQKLDAIAQSHGFDNYDALEDATATISLILAGIDPETGEFTEPVDVLKQELEDIKSDQDLDPEERKLLIEELEQAIAADPKVENPEDVELVRKFKPDLEQALQ